MSLQRRRVSAVAVGGVLGQRVREATEEWAAVVRLCGESEGAALQHSEGGVLVGCAGHRWRLSSPSSQLPALIASIRCPLVLWRAHSQLAILSPLPLLAALRHNAIVDPQLALWMLRPEDGQSYLLDHALKAYNITAPSLEGLLLLWKALRQELEAAHLLNSFYEQEMRLVPALAAMQAAGFEFDSHLLRQHHRAITIKMDLLQRDACTLLGKEVNLGSPAQMATVIFDELKLQPPSSSGKTAGGSRLKLTKDVLTELRTAHPIAALVLQYRKLQKLLSVWIEGLQQFVSADGRLHTQWSQISTATGRLASNNPNMQNLPRASFSLCLPVLDESGQVVRTDGMMEQRDVDVSVRAAVIARRGFRLVACDYSQMEMRLLAHCAGDAKLRKCFSEGLDIHRNVAAQMQRKSPESITSAEREAAKRVVYGLLYGMGPRRLSNILNVSLREASSFISSFLQSFPAVRTWMERTVEAAKRDGYVLTLANRRRPLPHIQSHDASKEEALGERQAVNTVIQGSASDILKCALADFYEYVVQRNQQDVIIMLGSVHDEILLEVREDFVDEAAAALAKIMQDAAQTSVPLVVTTKIGNSYAELK